MSIEVKLMGEACNLACPYCYEHNIREAANPVEPFDLDAVKAALERENVGPTHRMSLFGGDPLMAPIEALDELCRWVRSTRQAEASLQTNGALITDAHVDLFVRHQVAVGFSLDGPDELNDSRWAGSIEATREATRRSHAALNRLLDLAAAGTLKSPPSVIITLYRGNTGPHLPRLLDWIRDLDRRGMRSARLHLLQIDHAAVDEHMSIDDATAAEAWIAIADLQATELRTLQFREFIDYVNLLRARDQQVSCIFGGCDPYTTPAVRGVDGQGRQTNCGRAIKDGIDWLKAPQRGSERQVALYHIPQEHGGCADCRFFVLCKGDCPGTGIAGDWRNRTQHCGVRKATFEIFERRVAAGMERPVSLHPKLKEIEALFVHYWAQGFQPHVWQIVQKVEKGYHAPSPTAGKAGAIVVPVVR